MLCLPAPDAGTRGASHFGNSSRLPQPVVQRALPELLPEVSAPSCVLIVTDDRPKLTPIVYGGPPSKTETYYGKRASYEDNLIEHFFHLKMMHLVISSVTVKRAVTAAAKHFPL